MKSNYKRLGDYIHLIDVRNRDLKVSRLLGVSIEKKFIESIANIIGTDMSTYKIVKRGQFAYGPVTSRNGDKVSIALLQEDECIISSSYSVFEIIKPDVLLPEYLDLWFKRSEFDRYARFHSHGSAREIFDWEEMCNVELPIPEINEQRRIVDAYKAIEHRIEIKRKINDNLESQAKALYNKIPMDNATEIALKDFTDFQEGPGIRNWQFVSNGIPFVNIRCLQDGDINISSCNKISEVEASTTYKHFLLRPNDIIISTSGTLGKLAIIRQDHLPLCLNTSIIRFTPKISESDYSYLLYYLKSNEFSNQLLTMATGSAQLNFGPSHIQKMSILLPNLKIRQEFDEIVRPLVIAQSRNLIEIKKITHLLSSLLSNLSR